MKNNIDSACFTPLRAAKNNPIVTGRIMISKNVSNCICPEKSEKLFMNLLKSM